MVMMAKNYCAHHNKVNENKNAQWSVPNHHSVWPCSRWIVHTLQSFTAIRDCIASHKKVEEKERNISSNFKLTCSTFWTSFFFLFSFLNRSKTFLFFILNEISGLKHIEWRTISKTKKKNFFHMIQFYRINRNEKEEQKKLKWNTNKKERQ